MTSVGKLMWHLTENKTSLWVKWVPEENPFPERGQEVLVHPKKQKERGHEGLVSSQKTRREEDMKVWYEHWTNTLTPVGKYSITRLLCHYLDSKGAGDC